MMSNVNHDKNFEDLGNAIVLQAVDDYRWARRRLALPVVTAQDRIENSKAKHVKKETEEFFRSKWFTELTSVDGEAVLQKLMKERV